MNLPIFSPTAGFFAFGFGVAFGLGGVNVRFWLLAGGADGLDVAGDERGATLPPDALIAALSSSAVMSPRAFGIFTPDFSRRDFAIAAALARSSGDLEKSPDILS